MATMIIMYTLFTGYGEAVQITTANFSTKESCEKAIAKIETEFNGLSTDLTREKLEKSGVNNYR